MKQRENEMEPLESRHLASASYIAVGKAVHTNVQSGTAVYFSKSLPAGSYLVAVAGGSMTYKNSVKHPVYRVNDYIQGDFGFKIIQTGARAMNAPGLSVPKASGKLAAGDSVGLTLKFRHSVAGKIGIELLDAPYYDNAAGPLGSPVFILKQRKVVTAVAASTRAAGQRGVTPVFSSALIQENDLRELVA